MDNLKFADNGGSGRYSSKGGGGRYSSANLIRYGFPTADENFGDNGGMIRDDFPTPSTVKSQSKFTLRGGRCCGMTDSRKHSFHLERTLIGDKGGKKGRQMMYDDIKSVKQLYNYIPQSVFDWGKGKVRDKFTQYGFFADEGGLAAATGTPNERGFWLEDDAREREYTTGPIQDAAYGGRVARMEGRRSRHEPVLLLPNEVVLTEKQARAARKAGAKLPTHSLQKRAGKL